MSKPKVRLLSRPQLDLEAISDFLNSEGADWLRAPHATAAEELVEISGRVCYMSFRARGVRENRAFLANLIEKGHESVLEHAAWTVLMTGVSRAFTHQLVRHRAGFSFSQLSQQYHEETDAQFVAPSLISASPRIQGIWENAVETARGAYRQIVRELGDPRSELASALGSREAVRALRSAARSVLPNSTETKIVVTANARAFRHFLSVRGAIPGDEEMRVVCAQLLDLLRPEAPGLFSDFVAETLADGTPIVRRLGSSLDTRTEYEKAPRR